MVASKPAQGDVPSREGGHHPLPLPRLGHPLTLAVHRRGHPSSLTGACGEPGASKGACRVREAVRGNGPAARWAPRPGPTFTDRPQPLIVVFITGHADRVSVDGLRYGVEPICRVLTEHGVPIAPSTCYDAVSRPRPRALKHARGRLLPLAARQNASLPFRLPDRQGAARA
jgi:hypothetical protein